MSAAPSHDPHAAARTHEAGAPLADARAAAVLVHGRGGHAEDMLRLAAGLRVPGVAFLAPGAAGGTWYPFPFLAPLERNEPHLSSALAAIARTLDRIRGHGLGFERVLVLGFSQGGCLTLEFAARNARRYGGVVGWSAGLIGPEGTPRDYAGSLEGAPVLLACSDTDPHVPLERVRETAVVLERLGGSVVTRIYPGFPHAVHPDEIAATRALLRGLAGGDG